MFILLNNLESDIEEEITISSDEVKLVIDDIISTFTSKVRASLINHE